MKRLFAFALTALMLMGCFTGCCCCDFGLGDRIEQIVGEEMNEIVEEQVGQLIGGEQFGQLIGGEQFGQLIGGEITLPKTEATEPPDSDQWMPGMGRGHCPEIIAVIQPQSRIGPAAVIPAESGFVIGSVAGEIGKLRTFQCRSLRRKFNFQRQ